jgi:hypothetical protein
MANNKIVYGVDLDKPVTPLMVRDALVECFFQAHLNDAGLGTDNVLINKDYIEGIVRKTFEDSGDDFEKPTKKSIINSMDKLKTFAANFRDQSVIKKHAGEIMELINRLA